MATIDFKKTMRAVYSAPIGRFAEIVVPAMRFVKVDGRGDPNGNSHYAQAVQWLYATSYALKFAVRTKIGIDYVVPPLEGLWWADDPQDFVQRRKSRWYWTMMIMTPEFVDGPLFEAALNKARGKLGDLPASLRLEPLEEGRCLQTLHIGSYDDEGPILAKLHNEIMPSMGLEFSGHHHEVYLNDARKTSAEKLKTILRQPVASRRFAGG